MVILSGNYEPYRAHREKTLSRTALIIGYPILIIGATMDFIFNILFATIIFLDLPHEYMFTKRLVKYKKYGTGWRQSLANFICTKLLDPFDIGQGHCR